MNPVEAEVFEFLKDHVDPPIDAHDLQDTIMMGLPHLTIGQIRHSLGFLNNVGIIQWEPYGEGD
jgi:hypothetical protein